MALSTLLPTQKERHHRLNGKAKQPTITERGRLAEVRTCVQLCLDAMGTDHCGDIARRTGLCYTTIRNMFLGKVSLDTHIGTIQALGYAAGLRIEMGETKIRLSLVSKAG